MSKYNDAKIYKLWSPEGKDIYIGSTIQPLNKRLYHHKNRIECTSKILFDKYNDIRIELIETYPCECKKDLHSREGYYIRKIDCINKCIPGRTKKEYRENNKEYYKEYLKDYNEKNKEYWKEQKKDYYEKNKEQLRERRRQHYEQNKDKINERRRELYQEKKQATN